ncbi:30S ribosomal protein S4 [Candidatus Falkowbacteria bacterium CG10_big_fil_rev_8_21_14_0_10_39_11]|uniref:Small ribosomal subunit protein uS4 n=1 Tax=Candidatus Falkowbacteria bacterium CG10_big_fil_rev_8_21_14_0_10_39_11 TaxID=1974565 RepID=A0A2H0V5N1_9BACT|nr:MAG: 30S ribosomal protein S4 [Candidatus Falkowbacteria bacterium CG10_big_fil_rev_8_21_14_0_10_39_11]
MSESTTKTSKCSNCRRCGRKLFLKGERCNTANCALVKRKYAPGVHGQKRATARVTDYGRQLMEKQSARNLYNLREKQFRAYFDKAVSHEGETGQNFYQTLELRLDNVIRRLGWGHSIKHARQLVNHGHFVVNGSKVSIPSYQLRVNDIITIRDASIKNRKVFLDLAERLKGKDVAEWLFYDEKDMSAKVLGLPNASKVALDFDMKSIIEFYSR